MKVLLLKQVKKLGNKGDVCEVSDGYGRNYLLPNGLAKPATRDVVKQQEVDVARERHLLKKRQELYKHTINRLKNITLEVSAEAQGEKLFAAIKADDIASALKKQQCEVDKKYIEIEKPIKKLGEHRYRIRYNEELGGEFTLSVVSKEQ